MPNLVSEMIKWTQLPWFLPFLLQSDIYILLSVAVSAENEEMKQEGEQTECCEKEKENDQQKANVHSEDHKLVELVVPITPPLDVSRFVGTF